MGEELDRLEEFRPEGVASRILGMGDVVGLMQDFEEVVDVEKAEKDAEKMLKGDFNFDDFMEQMRLIQKMGPLQEVFEKMPMIGDMLPAGTKLDEGELVRIQAMCNSMTNQERRSPDVINDSRTRRIARGSGRSQKDVKGLLERFGMARVMMRQMGQASGLLGKMGAGPMGRLRRQAMDPSMLSGLQQMAGGQGMPGMPGVGLRGSGRKGTIDAAKKKALRKKARKSRKKNRRK